MKFHLPRAPWNPRVFTRPVPPQYLGGFLSPRFTLPPGERDTEVIAGFHATNSFASASGNPYLTNRSLIFIPEKFQNWGQIPFAGGSTIFQPTHIHFSEIEELAFERKANLHLALTPISFMRALRVRTTSGLIHWFWCGRVGTETDFMEKLQELRRVNEQAGQAE